MRGESVRRAVRVVACASTLVAACGFQTGPTLDVRVEQPALLSTVSNNTLCCCHVVGNVVNQSAVVVHATVEFDAFHTGEVKAFTRAIDFLPNLQPGERRKFTAFGIEEPCARVSSFQLVQPINVRGVFTP